MKKAVLPEWGGVAGVLAQAPVVSAAFGRWPGFVLMMTALLIVLALGVVTALVAAKGAAHLIGTASLSRKEGHAGAGVVMLSGMVCNPDVTPCHHRVPIQLSLQKLLLISKDKI
jgi:hypothetical protein